MALFIHCCSPGWHVGPLRLLGRKWPPDEFDLSDAVGEWRTVGAPEEVVLSLEADGSFSVQGWPMNLHCEQSKSDPRKLSDLSWAETVDYEGEWSVDSTYVLRFLSLDAGCRSNWGVVVWDIVDEGLELRDYLDPHVSTEDIQDEQILRFRRE